ncbi:MAG: hypothetical protein BGN82_02110 [Alphaproteobacteria bacterium 65-7]|nr:MAG: hypothetical protein BGN82_02110 [Alphaproteobacteria bacterium 65-7]
MDTMHPLGRAVFAGLAIFVVWMMVRAVRRGRIYARGREFRIDSKPIMFSLAFAVHMFIAAFCVWCAAGYDPRAFFEMVLGN